MNENPYEPPRVSNVEPSTDSSLAERLRQMRRAQARWSRRCWAIGGTSIFAGVVGLNVADKLHRSSSAFSSVADAITIGLLLFGVAVTVFSRISWFWFRGRS